jgi:Domain of unknown function (DUF5122) beta-propeller
VSINQAPGLTTADAHGIVTMDFGSFRVSEPNAVLQADGKIVVGGDGFAVARYNSDGSFDTSFGTGGSVPASTRRRSRSPSTAIPSSNPTRLLSSICQGQPMAPLSTITKETA